VYHMVKVLTPLFLRALKVQSIYEKGFMKLKFMHILCRRRTLLPIVLVLRKSVQFTENAKNASSITMRKARTPTVQGLELNNIFLGLEDKILPLKRGGVCGKKRVLYPFFPW
jgi:hypothetical protein